MLRTILSISGKPGLFKLVSQGKNMVIVESLLTGKRAPAYAHEKIIALGDIAIYTDEGETPLRQVFQAIQQKEEGREIVMPKKDDNTALIDYFTTVLPAFDRDRVYPNDIKKVLSWYNALTKGGLTDFSEPNKETAEEATEEKTPEA